MSKMVISVPIEKYSFSELSDDLARVRINVYHNSYNPNGSFFEDECFENSSESFKNKPICCAYTYDEEDNIDDFKEHNEEEKPIGVIPETNNYSIDDIDDLTWASVDGIIFKEYCPEAYELLKDGKKISMEIEVLEGFKGKDKFFHIKKFNLLCITVLGDSWSPAMGENATIEMFSQTNSETFATKFSAIINKANEIVGKMSTEGGKKVKREEIIAKFSTLKNVEGYKTIIEDTNISDEDLEKKLFALSQNQLYSAISEALSQKVIIKQYWDGESYQTQQYYLYDVLTDSNMAICLDCNDYKYYGVPYTISGDEATVDFAGCKRYVSDWRPYVGQDEEDDSPMIPMMDDFCKHIEEYAKSKADNINVKETEEYKTLESNLNTKIEDYSNLEKDLDKVKADFTTLNSNYSALESEKATLEEENKDLKQFKADKELEFKKAQVNEVLEKYTELQSIEGYDELVKSKFDYSLDELETKLKVFAFDNNVTISKKQKFSTKVPEKPVNYPIEKKVNSEDLGDWAILSKYIPENK